MPKKPAEGRKNGKQDNRRPTGIDAPGELSGGSHIHKPELKEAKTGLATAKAKQRIRQRTAQLTTANKKLRQEIAERKRAEALVEGQKRVLEMIAADAALPESLVALLQLIEAQAPGMLGSVLLLDEQGVHLRHGAAPSLPAEYVAAIDGVTIGPETGSCGTAAYCKEPVFVEDITVDPRWKNYREIAQAHGLRACWSTPILDAHGRVLGTFAMYYRHPALPDAEHRHLVGIATHVASIAISSHRAQAALRESEARLKEAQRLARIGYWDRDLLADRLTWSEETYRIWGRKPGEALTQETLQEWIHPDDRGLQRQALAELQQTGRPYDLEYRIIRPDGQIRFIHVWDGVEYNKSGQPIRIFGTVQDITERKQAAAHLQAQAQEIKAIVDNSPDFIARFDRELRRTYVNPAAVKTLALSEPTVLGSTAGSSVREGAETGTMAEAEMMRRSLGTVFVTGRPLDLEATWLLPSGRRYYAVHLEPEFDTQGACKTVVSIARDITELKQSQDALRQSESQLRLVIDTFPVMAWIVQPDGSVAFLNQRWLDYTGLSLEEFTNRPTAPIHPEDIPRALEKWGARMAGGQPYEDEMRLRGADGKYRWFLVRTAPLRDAHGKVLKWFGTSTDIEDRKQAEGELRENQRLLRLVLATLPVGVAVMNQTGDVVLDNDASRRIWGGMPIVAGPVRWARSKGFWHETGEPILPENWASVRALTRGQISLNELIDIETYDGQRKTIRNSAVPFRNAEGLIAGAVIVNEDVTEVVWAGEKLRQTEAELARVARLTIMGELTASIAHEVNQPLAAVVTNADAALRWLDAVPPNVVEAREAVRRIARDGTRAGEVVARIRALFKKSEPQKAPVNLNQLIAETVALIEAELKRKKVSWQAELAPGLPAVPADRVQVQQVLLNLMLNAIESLSTVADRSRFLRVQSSRLEPGVVHISIQDNGAGITPAESERLFQPFYSTKPQGLGMGLSLSRSIVEAHGGQLWAVPNGDFGVTFYFTLPLQPGVES